MPGHGPAIENRPPQRPPGPCGLRQPPAWAGAVSAAANVKCLGRPEPSLAPPSFYSWWCYPGASVLAGGSQPGGLWLRQQVCWQQVNGGIPICIFSLNPGSHFPSLGTARMEKGVPGRRGPRVGEEAARTPPGPSTSIHATASPVPSSVCPCGEVHTNTNSLPPLKMTAPAPAPREEGPGWGRHEAGGSRGVR